jgi:hypothetical protein
LYPNENELKFLDDNLMCNTNLWKINVSLIKKFKEISLRYKDHNNKIGKFGESYLLSNLRLQLRDKGYKWSNKTIPKSYRIFSQWKTDLSNARGGIDYKLILRDENCKIYPILLECSNWMKMHNINDYIYNLRIKSKFDMHDIENRYFHILAINKRNKQLLQERCLKDGILILEIENHISEAYLSWNGIEINDSQKSDSPHKDTKINRYKKRSYEGTIPFNIL